MTEIKIVEFINKLGEGTFLDKVTIFLSDNLVLVGLLLIALIFIYFLDRAKFKFILISATIALALHLLISEGFFKYLLPQLGFFKVRPFLAWPDQIKLIGKFIADSSFPSSHVSSFTAVMVVLAYNYKKMVVPAILVVLVISFVRVHNEVHYPTDVLAGAILGIFYGWLGIVFSRKIVAKT